MYSPIIILGVIYSILYIQNDVADTVSAIMLIVSAFIHIQIATFYFRLLQGSKSALPAIGMYGLIGFTSNVVILVRNEKAYQTYEMISYGIVLVYVAIINIIIALLIVKDRKKDVSVKSDSVEYDNFIGHEMESVNYDSI